MILRDMLGLCCIMYVLSLCCVGTNIYSETMAIQKAKTLEYMVALTAHGADKVNRAVLVKSGECFRVNLRKILKRRQVEMEQLRLDRVSATCK